MAKSEPPQATIEKYAQIRGTIELRVQQNLKFQEKIIVAMADSSDDDDFVSYGTALDPLDDDEARRKPVALEDQVVKDKEGRRRFHGAFTGGFSAGYFNTVGTKEGWAPSTFVSSRSQKAQQTRQVAEDFMDEDDLGEFGIAPRKIVTSKDFSNDELTRKRQMASVQHHAIPGEPPLPDLIVPNHESIGVQLLKKMGWKEGQGVGPKGRRRRNKKGGQSMSGSGIKQYGCAPPPAQGSDGSDDDATLDSFARDFLFAPKDSQDFSFEAKDDYHGIGYRGLDPSQAVLGGGHVDLFGDDRQSYSRSGKKGIKGKAFGIGAFEDEDDDIYSTDHMSRYDRVLGGEEPGDGKYGWTAPPQHHKGSESVLEGFKVANESKKTNKIFPAPSLPRNFRPFHSFESSDSTSSPHPSAGEGFKSNRFTLSAAQRGVMLGEEQLPGPTSVFEMISKEDKDKLKEAQSQQRKQSSNTAPPMRQVQPPPGVPTASDPKFQWGSGTGFQPFAKDPEKQRRYEAFLEKSKGSRTDSNTDIPLGSMTEWERQRESEEFARAANLYRPLSGLMATRFVTAKHKDEDTVEVAAEEGGDKDDQSKAAEMKMFGKLTRDTLEWHPDRLLCKRFNIPDPYPGSTIIGLPKVKKDTFSVFNFLTISTPEDPQPPPPPHMLAITQLPSQTLPSSAQEPLTTSSSSQDANQKSSERSDSVTSGHEKKSSRWDQKIKLLSGAENMTGGTKEASTSKTAGDSDTENRPPIDLFKAIFQSSSSSSSEDDDSDDDEKGDDEKESSIKPAEEETLHLVEDSRVHRESEQTNPDPLHVEKAFDALDQSKDASVISTGDGGERSIPYGGISPTSSQADGQAKQDEPKLSEDKQEQEEEYGPVLPPTTDQPERSVPSSSANRSENKHRHRDQRTCRYEDDYQDRQRQSSHSNKNRSRTHERSGDRHLKSQSRGHHEVRGQKSQSSGYSDKEDETSKHSRKESHRERHKHKEKHRHRHNKEKKAKKKKKKQDHKSRHRERRSQQSSASSDYDASDDTSTEKDDR